MREYSAHVRGGKRQGIGIKSTGGFRSMRETYSPPASFTAISSQPSPLRAAAARVHDMRRDSNRLHCSVTNLLPDNLRAALRRTLELGAVVALNAIQFLLRRQMQEALHKGLYRLPSRAAKRRGRYLLNSTLALDSDPRRRRGYTRAGLLRRRRK